MEANTKPEECMVNFRLTADEQKQFSECYLEGLSQGHTIESAALLALVFVEKDNVPPPD